MQWYGMVWESQEAKNVGNCLFKSQGDWIAVKYYYESVLNHQSGFKSPTFSLNVIIL